MFPPNSDANHLCLFCFKGSWQMLVHLNTHNKGPTKIEDFIRDHCSHMLYVLAHVFSPRRIPNPIPLSDFPRYFGGLGPLLPSLPDPQPQTLSEGSGCRQKCLTAPESKMFTKQIEISVIINAIQCIVCYIIFVWKV